MSKTLDNTKKWEVISPEGYVLGMVAWHAPWRRYRFWSLSGTVMRNIDGKFSTDGCEIFNTVSGAEIPQDEPLFLLRARDRNAVATLEAYRVLCKESGCNNLHIKGVEQTIRKFQDFADAHPTAMKQPGVTRDLKL